MSFEKCRQRPTPEQAIFPPTRAGAEFVVAPSLEFFQNELTAWHQRFQEADKAGHAAGRRMAQDVRGSLRQQAASRLAIAEMTEGMRPMDPGAVGDWYVRTVSLFAYSRSWLEVIRALEEHSSSLQLGFDKADVRGDFSSQDPHRTGFHSKREFLENGIGLDWPEKPRTVEWYEGESVFLQVSRPADPTDPFPGEYEAFYDQPFVPKDFASIVPRLKREVWQETTNL